MTRSTPSISSSGNITPTIDDDDIVAILDEPHILADLAQPAQRHQPQWMAPTPLVAPMLSVVLLTHRSYQTFSLKRTIAIHSAARAT